MIMLQVVQWVHDHMGEGEKKAQLGEVLAGGKFTLKHMPYDWGINS